MAEKTKEKPSRIDENLYAFVIDPKRLAEIQKQYSQQGNTPDLIELLKSQSEFAACLNNKGYWIFTQTMVQNLTKPSGISGIPRRGNYIDLVQAIAVITGADLQDPTGQALICTCPTECDCASPDTNPALKSMHCPIHNDDPDPNPDCPRHG